MTTRTNDSIASFLWQIIKPYRYHYLIMSLAPICSATFPLLYNYGVKLLIDLFINNEQISINQAFWPVFWFITAHVISDGSWRIHNYAQLKAMPYIFQRIAEKTCNHVFYLPYTYFQNNLAGSIIGKIRGIGDNYTKLHRAMEYELTKPLLISIFSGVILACTNIKVFLFIAAFFLFYTPLAIKFFKKLAIIEKEKQESWYHLFGTIADKIQNIFNIFSFATKQREITKIKNYYTNIHNH